MNSHPSRPSLSFNGAGLSNPITLGAYVGTGFDGDFSIDCIRPVTGVIAPVPEPTTAIPGDIGTPLALRRQHIA